MQRVLLIVFWSLLLGAAQADYLEVRREATIKQEPQSSAQVLWRPAIGQFLLLHDDGQQTNGYYRVATLPGAEAEVGDGWIYRTLVRRFPGLPPGVEPSAPAPNTSANEDSLLGSGAVTWPADDETSPEPHTIFGEPVYAHASTDHTLRRTYNAFSVYWDDVVLAPRWTAIKLTNYMADRNDDFKRKGRFKRDQAIVQAGLRATVHNDYNNLPNSLKWARGHMVQFDDARGWGDLSGEESFFTSNITPQLQTHNSEGWYTLEKNCTEFARDYGTVWVYTGPIYSENPQPFEPNREVPSPIAFYKIVVTRGDGGAPAIQAFRMPHEPIPSDIEVSDYRVSIDTIEAETEIDFLRQLPDPIEGPLEARVWELWPNVQED